jgi:hypothetical protein
MLKDVAPHDSPRLLMVRKAGASFASDLNICSSVFEAVLEEFASAGRELEQLRQQLVDQLHVAVPQTEDRISRNLLLKTKRAVFNSRPIASLEAMSLEPTLQKNLARYRALLTRRTELLESTRGEVVAELRSQLWQLTQNEEFRTAVDYSCPWLLRKYERAEEEGELNFSNAERAIHAYATKFFSKANPFYVFATVGFPSTSNDASESYCELIINTTLLLNLERLLLKTVSDPYQRRAYLRASIYQDNTFRFIIVKNRGLRLISAKENPLLRQVIAFFNDLNREHTVGNCLDFLLERLPVAEKKTVQNYLELLIKQGVVIEYLVKDFDNFKDDLFGRSDAYDELISNLQRLHLACFSRAELPEVHNKLSSLALDQTVAPETLYYVNTYERTEAGPHESLMHAVQNDLRDLKPLFPVSNFFERAYIIKTFLLDRVRAAPKREVPYVELMCEFMCHFSETIEKYQASVHRKRDQQHAIVNWLQRVSNCSGHMRPGEFAVLLNDRPSALVDQPAQETDPNHTHCFNGSWDYVKRIYYLANVFAGYGRFVSRYLLRQRTKHYQPLPSDDEWLDVQLVAPFKDNRSYLVTMLPTGCGFETRYRHYFERWINAANIVVGERDGRVVYRDGASGRMLRFHFFGFVLVDYLTADYQLLLTEHADCYVNLFEHNPITIGSNEFLKIPPLYYGSVCLRREQWAFSKSVLDNVCDHDDILTCTAKLREWLHDNMGTEEDEMYFRSWSPRDVSSPRYINLRNPLGVQTFRRTLLGLPPDSMISFARMEPPAAHLYLQNERPFLTELMIEV